MSLAASQLYVFGSTVCAGLALGILFDINSLVRRSVRAKAVSVIADIIYFILFFAVVTFMLYVTTGLILRAYAFAGAALGAAVYLLGLSRLIKAGWKKLNISRHKRGVAPVNGEKSFKEGL